MLGFQVGIDEDGLAPPCLNSASAPWGGKEAALKHTASQRLGPRGRRVRERRLLGRKVLVCLQTPGCGTFLAGGERDAERRPPISVARRQRVLAWFRMRSRALEDAPAAQAAWRLVATRGRGARRNRQKRRQSAASCAFKSTASAVLELGVAGRAVVVVHQHEADVLGSRARHLNLPSFRS